MKTVYYILLVLFAALGRVPEAGARLPAEYQIKAVFLYKFARFVEWPAATLGDPGDPIVLGILGEDPFGRTLEKVIQGKTAQDRELVVRRFARIQELESCHILFITSSQKRRLFDILAHLDRAAVLTVGEMKLFARDGGMIRLVEKDEMIRFEINPEAAARAGLKISSELLKLAEIVRDEKEGGKP